MEKRSGGKAMLEWSQDENELCDCWLPQGKQESFRERLKNLSVGGSMFRTDIERTNINVMQ